MAEWAAKLLLNPLVSVVNEKASSYLLEQYQVMAGMEEQHTILKRKLPAILDIIDEAEEYGAYKRGVKAWLEEVKTVAYEANDVFDEFKYEALRREAKKQGHYSKLGMDVVSLFPAYNPIVFRYRMGKKLRRIVQAIEVLVVEMNAFGFQRVQKEDADKRRSIIKQSRQTDSLIDDSEKEKIIGREAAKKQIVESLLSHADKRDLVVLPIVGMGGLGKTTLAQLVYNDPGIQKHFQELRWVCVSDDFGIDDLLKKITGDAREDLQIKNIRKRFLIVLDDVWNRNADKWAKLKTRLPKGEPGSAILTTTRNKEVAKIMGTVQPHELEKLEKKDLLFIFKRRAFGSEEKTPNDKLACISEDIVDKCCGSPLAAKALGSLLSTTREGKDWSDVLKQSSVCNEQTGILPILKLSYDNLPPHMKQCFAFCAVFPKNYEIDVEKLILLWIAHDFIMPKEASSLETIVDDFVPLKEVGSLETIGKQIFKELTSMSFFQEVKQVPFDKDGSKHGFCSKIVCKIHDLMHDVALSVMGKECVTITGQLNEKQLSSNATRHLFHSYYGMKSPLNHCVGKTASTIQTLLCNTSFPVPSVQHLSKCRSLRALCLQRGFPIRPKRLQHLRYMDLSNNGVIEALPEKISILYSLQTLNLSNCFNLRQLPRNMKYMSSLRHLYTDGCSQLKCMPPDLGQLTSLQTLTSFVVDASSDSSSIGELQHLNLGGQLELRHLENVTEVDARAARLETKEDITQLSFVWRNGPNEATDDHQKVFDALKPHNGLKAIRVHSYISAGFPTWMADHDMLKHLIEVHIVDCTMCEILPGLWQLPALQFVCLKGLDRLQCLCSGNRGNMTSTFPKLKELLLDGLNNLTRWREAEGQLIFPMLEILSIKKCSKLAGLPEAPIPIGTSDCNDNIVPSAFTALKVLKLLHLNIFKGWGAVEGREGEKQTFPHIISAFPSLKKLELVRLNIFKEWGAVEGREGEIQIFPLLENISINECPELTILPEAPKLKVLKIKEEKLQMFLSKAPHTTSLSILKVCGICDRKTTLPPEHNFLELVDMEEKWNFQSSVTEMELNSCSVLFSSSPVQMIIGFWKCLVCLEHLEIIKCDELKNWPEEEFKSLKFLKKLTIRNCRKLIGIGYAEVPEQAIAASDQVRPPLESLQISSCQSLTEILNLPPSLREIYISSCPSLQSIWGKQGRSSESLHAEHCDSRMTSSEPCGGLGTTASTSAPEPSPPRNHHLLPYLQDLHISACDSLVEVLNLPSSLTSMYISSCDKLQFLSGQLDALKYLYISSCKGLTSLESCLGDLPMLETLYLWSCKSLTSLPDGPQGYLSLRSLEIKYCPGIKTHPERLKQRLKSLKYKDISDARSSDPLDGPRTLDPKSWKYVMRCW